MSNLEESFRLGQKSRLKINSFINESLNKSTIIELPKSNVSKTSTNNSKNLQSDKAPTIKKLLINNEIANFTGLSNLGEDGLKTISEFVNANFPSSAVNQFTISNNLLNSISSSTSNINTPIAQNSTPINQAKKGVKFTEEIISNKKNIHDLNNSNNINKLSTENLNPNKNIYTENEVYRLKEIKLTKCNISDEGFSFISNCFDKSGSIQIINLKGNKLKDKSYKNILHMIKSNKGLKILILSQNLFSPAKKESIKINAKLLNPNLKLEI